MATKKIAEVINEISDMEELVNRLRTIRNKVDDNRQRAVELFGMNITDTLDTFTKSADYLLDLTALYKEKLNAVEVTI